MRLWMLISFLVLLMVTLNYAISISKIAEEEDLKLDVLFHAQCLADCNLQRGYDHLVACNTECNRLATSPKNGTCPTESPKDVAFECKFDVDCGDKKKCCSINMGRICINPVFNDPALFPVKPYDIQMVDDTAGEAYVQWKVEKVPIDNTLFIMESRNHFGVIFNELLMSEYRIQPFFMQVWKSDFSRTYNLISRKVQLRARRTYQFRVASVNQFGTHGFVESRPFHLIRDPFSPRQLRNVTLGRWFTYNHQTFCRQFSWRVVKSDLKIRKVKLIWYPLGVDNSTDQWTVSVNPHRISYEIRNFQPNTTYETQIIAISHFENLRYTSPPVTVEFTTPKDFEFIAVKSLKHLKRQPKWKSRFAKHNEFNIKY